MWPKKIGFKKATKKTIFEIFLLNKILEILVIPKIVLIEKDKFII